MEGFVFHGTFKFSVFYTLLFLINNVIVHGLQILFLVSKSPLSSILYKGKYSSLNFTTPVTDQ